MAKDEKKVIPGKNYIILLVIFVLFFLLIYYVYSWYKTYTDYQKDIPVIRDSLAEISSEEADHFISDNPTTIVYLCTANDKECRTFESKFKKLIKENSYNSYVTYINLSNTDVNTFITDFNNRYHSKKKLKNIPALVSIEDNKIIDVIDYDNELKISDVKKFLKENIGEE